MNKGRIVSPETRLKLSKALKGRPFTQEHRQHQLESIRTLGYRQKMSELVKIRYQDDEFRKSMGDAIKRGINKPEVIMKRSESMKRYYSDPANRKRMSDIIKTIPHTTEWNKNVSESLIGREFSDEHRKNIGKTNSGERNYGWLGGISFLPYSYKFNKKLKESIKSRDGYHCGLCGESSKLYIHHIDYDKVNCDPLNLISLCLPCHAKTNFHRNYWGDIFDNIQQQSMTAGVAWAY